MACKHLEALLPDPKGGARSGNRVRTLYKPIDELDRELDVDAYAEVTRSLTQEDIQNFVVLLESCGLQDYEVVLLVHRHAYGSSYRDIAKDLGYNRLESVQKLLKAAEAQVRLVLENRKEAKK